jgi:hypothetical protein
MMGSTQEAIQASASPAGSEPGRTSRAYMAYWEAKLLVPTATPERHSSQPTAFSGRREATMAPTVASITASAFPSHQSKTCAFGSERLRTKRRRLSAVSATQSVHSDQASQAATRVLSPPTARSCCLARSLTAPLYRAAVSQTLRQPLRSRAVSELPRTPYRGSSENSPSTHSGE